MSGDLPEFLEPLRDAATLQTSDLPKGACWCLGDRCLCPVCRFPTLRARGHFEICLICWWEDDGQDDAEADRANGGPNGRYSLTAARANFARHLHMYDPDDAIRAVAAPSAGRQALTAYVRTVIDGAPGFDPDEFKRLLSAEDSVLRARE